MRVIRAVLDTNIMISALLFGGALEKLIDYFQQDTFQLLASKEILKEYTEVLAYPKFKLTRREISRIIHNEIVPFVETVTVTVTDKVIKNDPSDNVFPACALAGRASYLVSGDRHLLALKSYRNIPIIRPARFLQIIDRQRIEGQDVQNGGG